MNCHLHTLVRSIRSLSLPIMVLMLGFFSVSAASDEAHEPFQNKYAKNFKIESQNGYRLVTVSHAFQGAKDESYRYLLYPRGTEQPDIRGVDAYVEVPVQKAITLSTTFLAAIDALGVEDSVVGVGSFAYVNTPSILKRIGKGEIGEVGSETSKNIEQMLALEPDVVFTNIVGDPEYDVHPMLNRMGIVSLITAAYMEQTILGRAEWVKFVGAFYDKLPEACQYFDAIDEEYQKVKSLVSEVAATERPRVFANAPWGNVWYIPSSTSYIANLLNDAGADYLWSDLIREGSQPMDFESVYERAATADVWINSGYLDTMQAIEEMDERYLGFKAVQSGRVFSETKALSEMGGNNIWERGFMHPEEILADVVKILHPDKNPNHTFIYYKRVQ